MFSWADLSTSNPAAAKTFYATLFGWQFRNFPAGEGQVYSMAQIDGENVAALYAQPPGKVERAIPPHWTCYHTVDDIDARAKRVSQLGGKLVAPPFDVFDAGRMCVLSEPAGALSALWQPLKRIGATMMGEHGTLGWAELLTRTPEASERFQCQLHGFKTQKMPLAGADGQYTIFTIGGRPSCGMVAMPENYPPQVPSHWRPYFNVDDCDAIVKTAITAGGTLMGPILEMPNVGRFAVLKDPQGAVFEVIHSETQQSH